MSTCLFGQGQKVQNIRHVSLAINPMKLFLCKLLLYQGSANKTPNQPFFFIMQDPAISLLLDAKSSLCLNPFAFSLSVRLRYCLMLLCVEQNISHGAVPIVHFSWSRTSNCTFLMQPHFNVGSTFEIFQCFRTQNRFFGPFRSGVSKQLEKNTNKHDKYYPKKHEHEQKRTNKYVF